jgi:hypothetical protein
MSNLNKLREAFKTCEGPFPWADFVNLVGQLGYQQKKPGKTAGSRRKFFNAELRHLIMVHAPHGAEMKAYAVRQIRAEFEERGLL